MKSNKEAGLAAELHDAAPGKAPGLASLRLQKTVIRTLSGADLQLVAGGACGGGSAVPPPDPVPPPTNTRCVGTVTKN